MTNPVPNVFGTRAVSEILESVVLGIAVEVTNFHTRRPRPREGG